MSNEELTHETTRHTTKTFLSFSMWQITWTMLTQTMGIYLFFFYHTVIGLAPLAIFVATAINTVWSSFNDPLIGFLTDRNFKWTRKWGRRFPWIVTGLVPWCFMLIFIFSSPSASVNPWPAFIWLLLVLIFNDLFMTTSDVHGGILRADKFRTEFERKKYSGYFGVFDMIAMALGTAIPPLLLFGSTQGDYILLAIIISSFAFVCAILYLVNGAREDKIIIDRYYSSEYERLKLLKGTLEVIKQKSFAGFWLSAAGWGVATALMTSLIAYLTTFVLVVPGEIMTVLFAIFIAGALVSVPIWLRIHKKINDSKKVYLIGSVIVCVALIPLTFFITLIDLAIYMFIIGFSMGCVWTLQMPIIFSHVQDDFVVRTGKNQKGILIGTWAILALFTAFIDELLIATVFNITGFREGLVDYAALEASGADVNLVIWGIRILVGIIPMIAMALGAIAFWKIYPLTQEKVLENKKKLQELGY